VASTTSRPKKIAWPQWEYDVIRGLGGKVTEPKLIVLNLWNRVEGMREDTNNWLAFTAPTDNPDEWGQTGTDPSLSGSDGGDVGVGPGQWNSFHDDEYEVTLYPTQAAGVGALVKFLNAGHGGIVAEFQKDDATVSSLISAIAADGGWGGDPAKMAALSGTNAAGELKVGVYGQGKTGDPSTTGPGGSAGFYQCKSSDTLIGGSLVGGHWSVLNACQAKALVGGLLVAVGGVIFASGIIVVAIASPLGSGAVPTIASASPIGRTTSWLKSKGTTTQRSTGGGATSPVVSPTAERDKARAEWSRVHGKPWSESEAGKKAAQRDAA